MLSEPRFHGDFERLARRIRELDADGIICDGDMTAVALLNAFRRLGVRVPEDVAIIGWGNALLAQASDPALTTVSYDLPKLLSRVVARLDESHSVQDTDREELSPPRTEFVQPLIVSRQSG